MTPKRLLSSKITILMLIVLLGFLANVKYRQWHTQQVIEKEKRILTEQVEAQQKKQDEFSRTLSYIKSSSFKERIAREELGLKREGEVVYGFTEGATVEVPENTSKSDDKNSNLLKWWEYFVDNN